MGTKIIKEVESVNETLLNALREKAKEEGLGGCIGGLEIIPCSKGLSLHSNIKNILAVFQNNYATSLFFQGEALKQRRTLDLLGLYLMNKGLLEDFEEFKKQTATQQYGKAVNIRIE